MIVVVTHKKTPRIYYVIDWLFVSQHQLSIKVLTDTEEIDALNVKPTTIIFYGDGDWIEAEKTKIQKFNWVAGVNVYDMIACGLLEDEGIQERYLAPAIQWYNTGISLPFGDKKINRIPILFPTSSKIGFDVLAMCFWILCRYEEYGYAQKHPGKRFLSSDSIFKRSMILNGWESEVLLWPLVDWVRLIFLDHIGIGATEEQPLRSYAGKTIPTIDVDIALKFGGRNWKRFLGGSIKELFSTPLNWIERIQFLLGGKDPYRLEKTLIPYLQQFPTTKWFLLTTRENNQYHKQVFLNKIFENKAALLDLNSNNTGIHPSVIEGETNMIEKWTSEIENLKDITGIQTAIVHNRFHYIHFGLPNHYNSLLQLGIREDWSMGYPDEIGFRAGTCFPFFWYNLLAEKPTDLIIHSFQIMDVTCKNYKKLNHSMSDSYFVLLQSIIESLGGDFCFIVHNESLSGKFEWKNWLSTFDKWFSRSK